MSATTQNYNNIYQYLKQTWRGEWDEGTIYSLNDTVRVSGKAYVCTTSNLYDDSLFGINYKPGIDTTNWQLVINGSVFKGDWTFKDNNYAGDIVRYNGSYYQCLVDNYGGHPIYENGGLSTQWALVGRSSREDNGRGHLWFVNYPPMGWTKNRASDSSMYGSGGITSAVRTINGNYEFCHYGTDNGNAVGIGTGAAYYWNKAMRAGFDFWDHIDGYRPSITGGSPNIIQVLSTGSFTMVLFDTGEVYATGANGNGQCGDGTQVTRTTFVRVGRSSLTGGRTTGALRDVRIIKIAMTGLSTNNADFSSQTCFALDDQGRVWAWGYNGNFNTGVTGQNQTGGPDVLTPTLIDQRYFNNNKIADIWAGGDSTSFTNAITESGELYTWGNGYSGQLPGMGANTMVMRPELVSYNWAQFGGIKKFEHAGSNVASVALVLTHDGQLHGAGAIITAGSSLMGEGIGPSVDTYVNFYQPLYKKHFAKRNSLGKSNRDLGASFDVLSNVEDFWVFASPTAPTPIILIVKEKHTGIIYVVGGVGDANGNIPVFRSYNNQAASDLTLSTINNRQPNPVFTGNMLDIKHIQHAGVGVTRAYMFLNSDGRLWTNSLNLRGIGTINTFNNTIRRSARLPWETIWGASASAGPAQIRFNERITAIYGITDTAGAAPTGVGFALITTNQRLVTICYLANNVWDPAQTIVYNWNPTRINM